MTLLQPERDTAIISPRPSGPHLQGMDGRRVPGRKGQLPPSSPCSCRRARSRLPPWCHVSSSATPPSSSTAASSTPLPICGHRGFRVIGSGGIAGWGCEGDGPHPPLPQSNTTPTHTRTPELQFTQVPVPAVAGWGCEGGGPFQLQYCPNPKQQPACGRRGFRVLWNQNPKPLPLGCHQVSGFWVR